MNNNVFQPEQLETMRDLFEEITALPWFSREEEARKSFAKHLLDNYPAGSFDRDRHFDEVLIFAERHYSHRS